MAEEHPTSSQRLGGALQGRKSPLPPRPDLLARTIASLPQTAGCRAQRRLRRLRCPGRRRAPRRGELTRRSAARPVRRLWWNRHYRPAEKGEWNAEEWVAVEPKAKRLAAAAASASAAVVALGAGSHSSV
mmetsp:Transcript_46488/g.143407  ORF Transcript_46488/g.143407 Transcript_46488/m.143407 type:complete len:130 (+) Transcript_46488:92-481(+)